MPAESLAAFFDTFAALRSPQPLRTSTPDSMQAFFAELSSLRSTSAPEPAAPSLPLPDIASLAEFVTAFAPLHAQSRRRGDAIDYWDVAGLARQEVRNASILRWLFDPRGSHGLGDALINAWLGEVLKDLPEDAFPRPLPHPYTVAAETYPLSNETSRIDIEIDGDGFLLIVEVKIDAAEGPEQVQRYLDLAQAKTGGLRPYLVIFLSPSVPRTLSSGVSERVIATTWRTCAASVKSHVRRTPPAGRGRGDDLALKFARHISHF